MKTIKVSYNSVKFNSDGTVYRQMITLDRELVERFNKYVKEYRDKYFKDGGSNGKMSEFMYLKTLEIKDVIYLKLTQTVHLQLFLQKQEINTNRILHDRNTCLKVV